MTNKILLIDDDVELCELIVDYLGVEGFAVEAANDGASGFGRALSGEYDLVVLDVMLPKMNGFDVLRKIREKSDIPVLMLTARGDATERVVGLETGADDYLSKPFNPRELAARLRAILRRAGNKFKDECEGQRLAVEDVEVNIAARSAKIGGREIELTGVEFDLLAQLLQRAGQVVSREDLSRQVLGRKLSPFDRSLDMHISNLRKKLGARADDHERIKTIRSVGYIYTVSSER